MNKRKNEIEKLGGIGASEIGKFFTGQGMKARTAHTCILEKAEELIYGHRREITTIAMQHGIFNEEEAYHKVVKPMYPNAIHRNDESIFIKDELWATPDVTDDVEGITIDIKCPYSVMSYFKNIANIPNTYKAQMQCQMLATKHKESALCFFLTNTQIDAYGNKIEYDIPLEKRFCFVHIDPEFDFQKEIEVRFDQFCEKRDELYDHLISAPTLSDMEFFDLNHKGKKVTRLKDKSNYFTWEGKIVRNQNIHYVVE